MVKGSSLIDKSYHLSYTTYVKYIAWDYEKNEKLKQERGVSFEEVVDAIFEGRILGIIDHPNQKKYPGQKMYLLQIEDYAYIVPYVEDDEKLFFKTVFASRKYTRDFIEKGGV